MKTKTKDPESWTTTFLRLRVRERATVARLAEMDDRTVHGFIRKIVMDYLKGVDHGSTLNNPANS